MNAQTKIEAATLASAYALAFAEIEGATKSANNPHFKSKYADLGAVIDAIKPALIKHDLFYTQAPMPSQGGVTVATRLHHASGEVLELGELFVPANKNDAQAYGSALTYARRYALVTAFGVPTEDDDGSAAARGQIQKGTVSPAPLINDDQHALLVDMLESSNIAVAGLLKATGLAKLTDLPADEFERAKDWVKRAQEAKKAKEAA